MGRIYIVIGKSAAGKDSVYVKGIEILKSKLNN